MTPGTGRIRRIASGNSGGVVATLCIWLRRTAGLALVCAAIGVEAQVPGALTDPNVRQSLARGYWMVRPGDRLRAIARRFFPHDRARTNRLRNALLARNPGAFVNGDANALLMRAKLFLPPDLGSASGEDLGAGGKPEKPSAAPAGAKPRPAAAVPSRPPSPAPPATGGKSDEPPPIAEKPPAAPPRAPSYIDRLIDESVGPELAAGRAEEEAPEPTGRRSLAIDVRNEWRESDTRRLWEGGVGVVYRRETALWGEWGLDADLRDAKTSGGAGRDHAFGGKITLSQYRFPVVGDWLADSSAGVLRSLPPTLVATGFRVNLPAPLLWGTASRLYNDSTRLYAYGGRGASLTGFATQAVELDQTRAGLLGLEHQALPGLRLGTQANFFRLADALPWQSSLVVAAEAYSAAAKARVKIAALKDDARRNAYWLEGEAYQGFFHHRFGAYQFDRDVVYSAVPTVSDERLLYLRTDYRTTRLSYSLALDASQTNLARDPARSGSQALGAFASVNLRMSRTLTSGGSLSVRHEQPRTALASRKDTNSETAFVRITSALGTASFDLTRSYAQSAQLPSERSVAIAWNHEWPVVAGINVSTTLSRGEENGAQGAVKRSLFGLTLRSFPATGIYVDFNAVRSRVERSAAREDNTNASFSASWQFLPEWQAQLFAIWNTVATSAAEAASPTSRDKSVNIVLRYQKTRGVPIIPLGARQAGSAGTGSLVGQVFFDENDDGIRQPNERPAAHITVFLDSRYPVTTDSEGRFQFPLVTAGVHTIQVAVENIPLPWGIAEEHGIPVTVPVRGEALVDIALRRMGPS